KAKDEKAKDKAKAKDEAPPSRRMIDRTYVPQVGDQAVLSRDDGKGGSFVIWASPTPEAFREYFCAAALGNEKRQEQLANLKRAFELDDEPPVRVLAMEPFTLPVGIEEVETPRGRAGIAMAAGTIAVTIRVLDGTHKGKVLITPIDQVVRF